MIPLEQNQGHDDPFMNAGFIVIIHSDDEDMYQVSSVYL